MKIYGVYKAWGRKGYQETEGLQFDCFCLKKKDAIEKIKKQYNDVCSFYNKLKEDNWYSTFIPYQEENGYAYILLNDSEWWKWNLTELEVKE